MENNLAVLIDFENIAAGTEKEGLGRFDVEALMQRVVDKGRVLVARSYADWGRFSRFKQSLLMANVTMIELTSHGMQDKNRADIAMVVDALDLAFTKDYVGTFIIVSGDSDFTPMVLKMRELNKRVIGVGTRSSSSRLLVQACDEFIFYDTIVKQKRQSRRAAASRGTGEGAQRQRAFDLLVQALEGIQRENPEPPLASVVKSAMRRKLPDFSEPEMGYNSFARFLEAAQEAGYVKVSRDRKSGGYRVETVDAVADDEDEDGGNASQTWQDPYLPEGTSKWVNVLDENHIMPLAYATRMALLTQIEQTVTARQSKRRRVNVQFVRDDVRKRIKKTHPDLPSRSIRHVFNALMQAGLLIHKDGTAIRSSSAGFHLEKTAEQLNDTLLSLYIGHLKDASCDLSDTGLLAELFLGNRERNRDIETALAWLVQSSEGVGDEADLNELDLDDLLVAEDDGPLAQEVPTPSLDELDDFLVSDETQETSEPEAEAEAEAKVVTDTPDASESAEPVVTPEPAAEEAPKKKTTRKTTAKKTTAKKTTDTTDGEAPKKKRIRRRKKVETPAPEEEVAVADDAPAVAPEKRTRRRTRKKEPAAEAAETSDPNAIDLDALLTVDDN